MSRRYINYNKKYYFDNKFDREWDNNNNYYPKQYYYQGRNNKNFNDYYYNNYNNYNYYNYYKYKYNYYDKNKRGNNFRKFYREVEIGRSSEIDEQILEELKKIGYSIKEVKSDGNCLFRAVSEQLEEDENNYKNYREICVDYMNNNQDEFIPFLDEDEPIDKYIEKLTKDGEWGGNLEIYALSKALHANFYIYIYKQPIYAVKNWESPDKNVLLTYHNGKHYNSLRKLEKENNDNDNEKVVVDVKNEEKKEDDDNLENKDKMENDLNANNEGIKDDNSQHNKEKGKNLDDISDLISKINHLNI